MVIENVILAGNDGDDTGHGSRLNRVLKERIDFSGAFSRKCLALCEDSPKEE
jgi:hypothetical protein